MKTTIEDYQKQMNKTKLHGNGDWKKSTKQIIEYNKNKLSIRDISNPIKEPID